MRGNKKIKNKGNGGVEASIVSPFVQHGLKIMHDGNLNALENQSHEQKMLNANLKSIFTIAKYLEMELNCMLVSHYVQYWQQQP